jgi:hypothetical protein
MQSGESHVRQDTRRGSQSRLCRLESGLRRPGGRHRHRRPPPAQCHLDDESSCISTYAASSERTCPAAIGTDTLHVRSPAGRKMRDLRASPLRTSVPQLRNTHRRQTEADRRTRDEGSTLFGPLPGCSGRAKTGTRAKGSNAGSPTAARGPARTSRPEFERPRRSRNESPNRESPPAVAGEAGAGTQGSCQHSRIQPGAQSHLP